MTSLERKSYRELASGTTSESLERLGLGLNMSQTVAVVSTNGGETAGRKRKRQTKQKKDPGAPKRPTTAFFYFAQVERPNVRKIYPDFKVTEISKELGKMWKGMTTDEKSKYEQRAKDDRQRYETEIAEYKAAAAEAKRLKAEEEEEEEEEDTSSGGE